MTTPLVTLPSADTRLGFFATLGLALRTWTPRQVWAAVIAAAVVGVVIGVATVLIPNPIFAREIPPVWWNYPVWILTSVLSGILVATYVRTTPKAKADDDGQSDRNGGADLDGESDRDRETDRDGGGDAEKLTAIAAEAERSEKRTSRMGMAGGVLAWFAVGCPVCNKIALLALGYSGAITYFSPIQPFLALGAMVLTGVAVVVRLRGQVSCKVPRPGA